MSALVRHLIILALLTPAKPASSQTTSYFGGVSNSRGEASEVMCTLTLVCGVGTIQSAKNLWAPVVGIARSYHTRTPLWFETGLGIARKGWGRTNPPAPPVYVEIPALLHLGYWPRPPAGLGFSVAGGAALDLALPFLRGSQLAGVVGGQILAGTDGRSLLSIGIWYSRGINKVAIFHIHTWTFTVGFTPHAQSPDKRLKV